MPISVLYQDFDSVFVTGGTVREQLAFKNAFSGLLVGYVKKGFMAKDVKHFQEKFRQCMYQLTDGELYEIVSEHPIEAERLRLCLRTIEANENQEDEA